MPDRPPLPRTQQLADVFVEHLHVPEYLNALIGAIEDIGDPERRAEVARRVDADLAVRLRAIRARAARELKAKHGTWEEAAKHLRGQHGEPLTRARAAVIGRHDQKASPR